MNVPHRITQHIRYGLMPSPSGTLLSPVAMSYMLVPLCEIAEPHKR
jgi:hypothetical protein